MYATGRMTANGPHYWTICYQTRPHRPGRSGKGESRTGVVFDSRLVLSANCLSTMQSNLQLDHTRYLESLVGIAAPQGSSQLGDESRGVIQHTASVGCGSCSVADIKSVLDRVSSDGTLIKKDSRSLTTQLG